MSRSRRTEHCWPVAHTLDDLLPLIPDPASLEVGSVLRIERLMLEPVRNQFIVELAERYTSQGYGLIYLVDNAWGGVEIEETGIKASVISKDRKYGASIRREAAAMKGEGLNPVLLTELPMRQLESLDELCIIGIPRAVLTFDPVSCPYCGALVFTCLDSDPIKLWLRCTSRSHVRWCQSPHPITHPPSGQGRGQRPKQRVTSRAKRQPWILEDETLARELRALGMTYAEVGKRLGRSWFSVCSFLRNGGMEGTRKRQQARAYLDQFDI